MINLIEVIKRKVVYRSEAFQRSDSWIAGHRTTQKIKRWVIWEGCSVIDKWHACSIVCGIILKQGTWSVRLIIIKKEVISIIPSYVTIYILFRSLSCLNDLQQYTKGNKKPFGKKISIYVGDKVQYRNTLLLLRKTKQKGKDA